VTSSWDWPTGDFSLYLADYDPESMGQYFFDAIYADNLMIRCKGGSSSVQFCGDLTDAIQQMMAVLINRAMTGDLQSMQCDACDPYLEPAVAVELGNISSNFSEDFEVYPDTHYDGTILVITSFESGYQLRCYFRGDEPIIIEKCSGSLD
jgi:hypothetical protein